MEWDFGSWCQYQHSDLQSPDLNTLRAPFNHGKQNTIPAYMNPCANTVSTNGTLLGSPFSGVSHFKAGQLNEHDGWFHCLPRFQQALSPLPNSILKEKSPAGLFQNCEEIVTPKPASECAQKKFLVFDQSGDQTTLIFSSGIGTPVQCLTTWCPKFNGAFDLNKIELGSGKETVNCPGPILTDEHNENLGDDVGSEMHEDTEELDALLYSDDDDDYYSEDDEEASTGHSPSTMTVHDKQEWFDESAEEVASSAGPTKRMKLFDGGYDVPSLMDTASSAKHKRCFDCEDYAESSCADSKIEGLGESGSLSSNKRSRKDKIRETVNVLQNIIPGGKGKDAVVILDEAIHYLRSLKHKAEALGFDTL